MSSSDQLLHTEIPARTLSKARLVLLLLLLAVAAWFLYSNALRYFGMEEDVFGRYWPRRGWLMLHIVGGTVALLAGLFQLWSGLGGSAMKVHPWTGRVYVGAIGISALSAFVLAALTEVGMVFALGLTGLGVAWVITTGLAWISIRRGLLDQHKEWMVRSYVVTFGFVSFRAFTMVTGALEIGTGLERASTASWFCWAAPLLLTEAFIQGRKIFRAS